MIVKTQQGRYSYDVDFVVRTVREGATKISK